MNTTLFDEGIILDSGYLPSTVTKGLGTKTLLSTKYVTGYIPTTFSRKERIVIDNFEWGKSAFCGTNFCSGDSGSGGGGGNDGAGDDCDLRPDTGMLYPRG